MKNVKKSKLLTSIDKIIDNYELPKIKIKQSQFDDLLRELYPFLLNKSQKKIEYRGRIIEIIDKKYMRG
jgi:hypothetical protein